MKVQNIICSGGCNAEELNFRLKIIGRVNKINIAANIATTPPSLLGIERKIAYAQRKYHSGLIWRGVIIGFAGMKFSASPNMLGKNIEIYIKENNIIHPPKISFLEYAQ